jgi:hypothetical protein
MSKFVKIGGEVHDLNKVVSVGKFCKDIEGSCYFNINYFSNTNKLVEVPISCYSVMEYKDFVRKLVEHQSKKDKAPNNTSFPIFGNTPSQPSSDISNQLNQIIQVQKSLMAEVAKLQKMVEDLTLAHAYMPGGHIAKEAENDFFNKSK